MFCRATLKDVSDYLKTLPCSSIKTMKAGANILDEGIVQAIENAVDKVMVNIKKKGGYQNTERYYLVLV